VSRILGFDQTLEVLDRLKSAVQSAAARADQLEREAALNRSRIHRQAEKEIQDLDTRHSSALAELEAALRSRKECLQTGRDRRQARLLRAHAAARKRHLKSVESQEGRQIFEAQRQLLQTDRTRDSQLEAIEQNFAAFQESLARERDTCAALERRIQNALRGYASFRRLLRTPAEPASSTSDENGMLNELRDLLAGTRRDLRRFRLSPLPLFFSLLPPWPLALLLAVIHAAAVPILPRLGIHSFPWQRAAVSLAVALVGTAALHTLGKVMARRRALSLVGAIARARALVDACAQTAQARYQQDMERTRHQAETDAEALHRRWNNAVEEAEQLRKSGLQRFEEKLSRASATNERLFRFGLDRLQRDHDQAVVRLQSDNDSQRRRIEESRAEKDRQFQSRQCEPWLTLETEWTRAAGSAYADVAALRQCAETLFPEWSAASCENWSPPSAFAAAAPFAHAQVDVEQLAGTLPRTPRLALPGPTPFELPLLLTCAGRASLLLETNDWGRDLAIDALNNLVLRFLSVAPPGRAVFTVFDPLELGQSFAGLMHLTDHEDRLINRRIWTQPEQIEQRLAEINEHIEKVTQLYLRNEYATLAEYNEQAGRIAEPYHFLVVADFPVNFSDLAVRRLLSIATGGPRCGVFILIHSDRRKITGADFVLDDLRKAAVCLRAQAGRFVLAGVPMEGVALRLDPPPDPDLTTAFLEKVGRCSVDSHRVEMPFSEVAPDDTALWTLDTAAEIRVPIGRSGAARLQYLALGKGTRQHALVAGKTGSGKSTLLHVIITNLALWCSPDQIEFYLVDFKKGVEFKGYAAAALPHARVVAIESDREFGLSVLERLDEELRLRGDLFRRLGVQDLAACKRAGVTRPLPRALLIIDEFQEFFVEDDRVSQNAALLLDRLIRQGRAFGIHVLLGSQTLGGAYTLARTTLGQMVVRIALQCNEADACLIMDDENPAPRLLSRPGEALYNDEAGAIEGNSPFQVVWLPEQERAARLELIRRRAAQAAAPPPRPFVFEGNAPADVRDNPLLQALLEAAAVQTAAEPRVWLGAPNAIKGPTEVVFRRQSGNNLLILGQHDESALAMLGIALVALAAQHGRDGARFILLDLPSTGSRPGDFLQAIVRAFPHPIHLVGQADLGETLVRLVAEMDARAASDHAAAGPPTYLLIQGIQRFKGLRQEDEFSLSLDDTGPTVQPGRLLNRIICEGTHLGFHLICICDTLNNAHRFFSRKTLGEFELRVLFQMSANDSASLIDTPKAATLGLHRALLQNTQSGILETFRPYALPDSDWVAQAARHLSRLFS
jgi:hypothetical protein